MNFPAVLLILDGWGIAEAGPGNALSLAHTPTFDRFDKDYLKTELDAAGVAVGLPPGHQGSSEMGHLMIGAGRPVLFPQTQVAEALRTSEVMSNVQYRQVMEYCKESGQTLHLFGLLSDRGVHAYAELCFQLLRLAKEIGVSDVAIHIIADGRDTEPCELPVFVAQLEEVIREVGVGEIATLIGRYYAMDRDQRWDRVACAYRLYTEGNGLHADDIHTFLESYYRGDTQGETPCTDEFIPPVLFRPELVMKAGDGVIFWNFRVDRAVEITQALCEKDFNAFHRNLLPLRFVATTQYYDAFDGPVAFQQERVSHPLGQVLADHGIAQVRIAETEKWAYVTKIFDGYQEIVFPKEEKVLLPSDKVATYDLRPGMQAMSIAQEIVRRLQAGDAEVIIANIANADMVAHTTNIPATVAALEVVDAAVALIEEELKKRGGFMCITADHGNCEHMLTADGKDGSHTANKVPFYVISYNAEVSKKLLQSKIKYGTLTNVAPTFLYLLGVPVPNFMSSPLLI